MSPITRSKTSPIRYLYPDFPSFPSLELAYNKALPRLQQDAKQMLEIILDEHEVRVHFYNPSASPEYWLVNNEEALEEVVYYKMKIRLVMRYKQQLMDKGIDISEIELPQQNSLPHKELFPCGTLPVMDIYKLGYEKEYSFFHEEEEASSSTAFYQPSSTSPHNFFSLKFESSQTLLGDYTDTEIDDTMSPPLVHHHHGRAQFLRNIIDFLQLPINWPINLLRREIFYFVLIILISFSVFG